MQVYDPRDAAQQARAAQTARAATEPPEPPPAAVRDPLPYCIYATVALLAWISSPPLAVAFFAGLGLRAYGRAYRAGLRKSDCILGDPRRVMLYLGALLVAGVGAAVWQISGLFL